MDDLESRIARQAAFSRAVFGPGERRFGVIEHIREELEEIEQAVSQDEVIKEWVDVAILAWDGLMRAVREDLETDGRSLPVPHSEVARVAIQRYVEKLNKNEMRDWPDWRSHSQDEPINHKRGTHD